MTPPENATPPGEETGQGKGAGGRPSSLTPDCRKKLLEAIGGGSFLEPACRYAGISYRTFRNWVIQGETAKSGQFFQFVQDVRAAEAQAELRMVATWQKAAIKDAKAAQAFLQARFPERWRPVTTKHEISGPNGGPIQTETTADLSRLDDDELAAYRALIAKTTDARRD